MKSKISQAIQFAGEKNLSSFKREIFSLLDSMKDDYLNRQKDIFQKEKLNEVKLGENVIEILRNIVESKDAKRVSFLDGSSRRLDSFGASAILKVHDVLMPENQKKMEDVIVQSEEDFKRVLDFSLVNSR